MEKDLMHISELEEICPEVSRRTLQPSEVYQKWKVR
jgi:hypothetical protein